MDSIQIKKIGFQSYIELLEIVGFIIGIFSMIILILNIVGLPAGKALSFVFVLITPVLYAVSGALLGVITYIPYKGIMKYKKGTILYFEKHESQE